MTEARALTIYKASAGSGKTYTLSIEYIKLLIAQPQCYRRILAVTFTNKATEEMKLRILSQLYGIWKLLPDSRSYINRITSDLSISEAIASKQAGIALCNIIHDYTFFRIETIDSFFHGVLSNLSRELDLTANLRIELNDYQIEELAVEKLIEELNSKDELLKWIISFVKENIEDNKSWNVVGQIKEFGRNIFSDSYKTNRQRLNELIQDSKLLQRFCHTMREIIRDMSDSMKRQCETFSSLLSTHGYEIDDFAYKEKGVCSYFIKLSNGEYNDKILSERTKKAIEDSASWVSKTTKDKEKYNQLLDFVQEKLQPLLIETEQMRSNKWRNYQSARLTLRHINNLRLLNSIEDKVKELNADANRFLLSDTQFLLHSLIDESDSPFIFEKIGTQLEYVMIDEFQDTGTIQWKNFKVLLEECMSRSNNGNLIVGDVKQSIYRWRSGDWRLLNDIESQFSDSDKRLTVKALDTNYRSCRRIVEFNNIFFNLATQIEYERQMKESGDEQLGNQLIWAYNDVVQKMPPGKPNHGSVSIELLPKDDYQENMLSRIGDILERLISGGATQNSIAIIVRSNDHAQLIAEHFSQEGSNIRMVSDEAFKIESSVAVNIIINAMRYLMHPEDNIAMAYLVKAYCNKILHKNITDDYLAPADASNLLPALFVDNRLQLLTMSLYDIVEHITIAFQLHILKEESAYLCTFYDLVCEFIKDNTADLVSFIEEWDKTIHKKTIHANEVDGVRIITIHKSKGLEFDNVIMPFCDWQLNKKHTIWCEPKESPFNMLPIIPIEYDKTLKGTIFEKDYQNEHLQDIVDNLNLLYVAFTRASNNLFVIGQRNKSDLRSDLIEKCLPQVADSLSNSTFTCDEDKSEPIIFEYGDLFIPPHTISANVSGNVFFKPTVQTKTDIKSFVSKIDFRQSNKSREFTETDDNRKQNTYIKLGSVLHKLFSSIRTANDIEKVLEQLDYEGVLYDCGMKPTEMRSMLAKRLSTPIVADWFSNRWQTFNECSILSYDAEKRATITHRPDRVMTDGEKVIVVDFKFGTQRPEYQKQVKQYMSLISDMGYKNVEGYLWFVYSNKIIEIK